MDLVPKIPAKIREIADGYNALAAEFGFRPVTDRKLLSLVTRRTVAKCETRMREVLPEFSWLELWRCIRVQAPAFVEQSWFSFEWLLKRESGGPSMNAEKVLSGNYRSLANDRRKPTAQGPRLVGKAGVAL